MAHTNFAPPRAAIVGSGPNGLTAAAVLARHGWTVDVYEKNDFYGGASSSDRDGFGQVMIIDRGAAGHPFGIASPAFRELELHSHGLRWCQPDVPAASPLEDGSAAILHRSLERTAAGLGVDAGAWRILHRDMTANIDAHLDNILSPMLRFPAHPIKLAEFGVMAIWPAMALAKTVFRTDAARALFAGAAAHAITPMNRPFTSAFGLLFGSLGMSRGWPVAKGGSQAIVDALVSVIESNGGTIHLNHEITDMRELGRATAVVLNLTPAQILQLRGVDLSASVERRMRSWEYGPGVYKIDYLLSSPIPWTDPQVASAGTVHVGGTIEEIDAAERAAAEGTMHPRPFVMVCQQNAADPSRSPDPAKHVVWAYAHVPNGYIEKYPGEVRDIIENQISRFAPGFTSTIIDRREQSPADLNRWNPNLVGGDVAGGGMNGLQSVFRPGITLNPYKLRRSGLYIASSSTPPGAGVHGMPGYWAARNVLSDFTERD